MCFCPFGLQHPEGIRGPGGSCVALCAKGLVCLSCCRFRLVAEPAGSIMVAPSLYGGADDGEAPDDPWAAAAREADLNVDDDTTEIYTRPRRAWRRGEAGETPDGADNGPPTAGNHEQSLSGDRNVREETWDDPAWQSWEGYSGNRNIFSGGPRHWNQWSEGWPWNDWAADGWNSQTSSTTAGYDAAGRLWRRLPRGPERLPELLQGGLPATTPGTGSPKAATSGRRALRGRPAATRRIAVEESARR